MVKRLEVYKCEACGNIVEVLVGGAGSLICCGKQMQLLKPGTVDAATEKHVPVIEKSDGKVIVKVGEVAHPMEDKHYIQWIELEADGAIHIRFLNPGDKPEAVFNVDATSVTAREYCNLHGLWKG